MVAEVGNPTEKSQFSTEEASLKSQPTKKRKLTVGLFTRDQSCLMEDYINGSFEVKDVEIDENKEKAMKVKAARKKEEIDEQPENYFNFGFNREDYKRFLSLLFHRRVHR